MNPTCPQCKAPGPGNARFCPECGTSLGATLVQGRTVVMTPTRTDRAGLPAIDVASIVQRARTSFGQAGMVPSYPPTATQALHQPEDTFLVNDHSGSMGEELDPGVTKLEGAIRASINYILNKYRVDPNDRIGIIAFSDHAQVLQELSPLAAHKATLIQTLQRIEIAGGTDINSGVVAARDHFDWSRKDGVRRIVLLTDGHGGHPLRTAEDLKQKGVVIDVIAIGPAPHEVNEELLRKVASPSRYRFIKDAKTLVQHYTQLATKTAKQA